MRQPSFFKALFLLISVLFLTRCDVLRDLTTERPRGVDSKEAALRRDIVDYAQRYEGKILTPAKILLPGLIAPGLLYFVMKEYGIMLSPSSKDQSIQGRSIPVDKAMPGDLIFFRRSASEPVFHVSLVIENDGKSLWVVHSTTSRGVIQEDLLASSYWKPKIYSARDVISGR
ncbi:MAG: DUF1175 family protein [Haliscomenobacter sp.]|nr:DUF1175 family protein [Haliscomenobacter sp.]